MTKSSVRLSVFLIVFIFLSISSHALTLSDDFTHTILPRPIYENMQIVKETPNSIEKDVGYYTLADKKQKVGSIVYRVENAEKITVVTYTTRNQASFVSRLGNELVRGYDFTNILSEKLPIRYSPSEDSMFVEDGALIFRCQLERFKYRLVPSNYATIKSLPYYGLQMSASADGSLFEPIKSEMEVRCNGELYTQMYSAPVPSGKTYIKLEVHYAPQIRNNDLTMTSNQGEEPLKVSRVHFQILDSSSSSSSSEDPSSSSSSSHESSSETSITSSENSVSSSTSSDASSSPVGSSSTYDPIPPDPSQPEPSSSSTSKLESSSSGYTAKEEVQYSFRLDFGDFPYGFGPFYEPDNDAVIRAPAAEPPDAGYSMNKGLDIQGIEPDIISEQAVEQFISSQNEAKDDSLSQQQQASSQQALPAVIDTGETLAQENRSEAKWLAAYLGGIATAEFLFIMFQRKKQG